MNKHSLLSDKHTFCFVRKVGFLLLCIVSQPSIRISFPSSVFVLAVLAAIDDQTVTKQDTNHQRKEIITYTPCNAVDWGNMCKYWLLWATVIILTLHDTRQEWETSIHKRQVEQTIKYQQPIPQTWSIFFCCIKLQSHVFCNKLYYLVITIEISKDANSLASAVHMTILPHQKVHPEYFILLKSIYSIWEIIVLYFEQSTVHSLVGHSLSDIKHCRVHFTKSNIIIIQGW